MQITTDYHVNISDPVQEEEKKRVRAQNPSSIRIYKIVIHIEP